MIFRQSLRPETGCASYLLGCVSKERCAVIDPLPDLLEQYLGIAAGAGLRITHVIDTHVHADHVSGARELAERTGALLCLHEAAEVGFPFTPLRDGQCLKIGNDALEVLHTPGHTPESICLVAVDHTRGDAPWLVLTGDTLFVGDAGRPDLHGEGAARELAEQLYESLFDKLLKLPDWVEVYPGHFSGSVCGRGLSAKPSSTIGYERLFNPALQPRSPAEFVAFMLAGLPPQPVDYESIRALNRRGGSTAVATMLERNSPVPSI
jgi:hydroxyacylglutathione hydrolase